MHGNPNIKLKVNLNLPVPTKGSNTMSPGCTSAWFAMYRDSCGSILVFPMNFLLFNDNLVINSLWPSASCNRPSTEQCKSTDREWNPMTILESMILLVFQAQSGIYNIHIVSFWVVIYVMLIDVYQCCRASIFSLNLLMSKRKTVPLPPTLKKAAVCFTKTTYLIIQCHNHKI